MVQGHKQYSMESTPMHEPTYRVINPSASNRAELKKRLPVTWFEFNNFENEWEATFEAEYEETFWEWAGHYYLEYWMVSA